MTRRVFFSFEYEHDGGRAIIVRNSALTRGIDDRGIVDGAEFKRVEQQGDTAVKKWIEEQLVGTSVTVVLVGEHTCSSKWVKYGVEASKDRGNGLLGIDISKIENANGETSRRCARIPGGYAFYLWFKDMGYERLDSWVDDAAKAAGN